MPRPCRFPAMPCRVNSHSNAAPLSFYDSAVFFVKVRVLNGNIRTANPIYASDKLRETLRGNWKKLNEGRSPTCPLWTADAILHMPCHAMPCHAMPMTRCETALRSRFQKGMVAAWVWHGRGMACVNQTRPHCVNQMGKTI
jgi:hypothetical protein